MHGHAIDTLYVIVPESKFKNADPTLIPKASAHAVSVRSDVLKIELVGDDDGEPKYYSPPGYTGLQPDGTPGVVSVTRALGPTGFASAVTGAFDVRIILTEEPAAFDASHILVDNGTAGAPVAGSPIDGGTDVSNTDSDLTFTYAGGGYTMNSDLPNATGRDNKYQQYLVTITPTPGFVGDVVVSVGAV